MCHGLGIVKAGKGDNVLRDPPLFGLRMTRLTKAHHPSMKLAE